MATKLRGDVIQHGSISFSALSTEIQNKFISSEAQLSELENSISSAITSAQTYTDLKINDLSKDDVILRVNYISEDRQIINYIDISGEFNTLDYNNFKVFAENPKLIKYMDIVMGPSFLDGVSYQTIPFQINQNKDDMGHVLNYYLTWEFNSKQYTLKFGGNQLTEQIITSTPISFTSNWNAQEGEAGHIENRTHYFKDGTSLEFYDFVDVDDLPVRQDEHGMYVTSQDVEILYDEEEFTYTLLLPKNTIIGDPATDIAFPILLDSAGEVFEFEGRIYDETRPQLSVANGNQGNNFRLRVYNTLSEMYIPSTIARISDLENSGIVNQNTVSTMVDNAKKAAISSAQTYTDLQVAKAVQSAITEYNKENIVLLYVEEQNQVYYTGFDKDTTVPTTVLTVDALCAGLMQNKIKSMSVDLADGTLATVQSKVSQNINNNDGYPTLEWECGGYLYTLNFGDSQSTQNITKTEIEKSYGDYILDFSFIDVEMASNNEIATAIRTRITYDEIKNIIDSNKKIYIKYDVEGHGLIPCSAYNDDLVYISFLRDASIYQIEWNSDGPFYSSHINLYDLRYTLSNITINEDEE